MYVLLTESLSLPGDAPTVSSVTDSSVVIKWKRITNVPEGLSGYYQYAIEYKENTASEWVESWEAFSHDPSSNQFHEGNLTRLKFNTLYYIKVKSYRVKGADREGTGNTEVFSFTTKCRGRPTSIYTYIQSHQAGTSNHATDSDALVNEGYFSLV